VQLKNVTFDAADPARLAAFWAEATGRKIEHSTESVAMLAADETNVRMLFLKVPEEKTAKSRVHVDFGVPDREAEVDRLVGLGATRHDTHNEWGIEWTVMTDPEGNEFCVAKE
jgi:predicted enzyme related to lactoylglutathione lyase